MSARDAALARYYDLDLQDDPGDLDLYVALARRTTGPILELAVGSGRVAVPLAEAGNRVTGVDLDPAMLERAQAAWDALRPTTRSGAAPRVGSLHLVEGDITSVRLEERFDLVILALNSLLLLDERERQRDALRTMAGHLTPEGRAVVDVWLPTPDDLALYDGRLLLEWIRADPATGEQVTKTASARYDTATASVVLTQLFDAAADDGPLRRTVREDRMRLVPAAELGALGEAAGLRIETMAGDYRMAPFGPGAERVVMVFRAL